MNKAAVERPKKVLKQPRRRRQAKAARPAPAARPGKLMTIQEWEKLTPEQKKKRNEAAIKLLRSWREATGAEAEEQRETGAYLRRVLDEDRLTPDRKLFP